MRGGELMAYGSLVARGNKARRNLYEHRLRINPRAPAKAVVRSGGSNENFTFKLTGNFGAARLVVWYPSVTPSLCGGNGG